MGDCSNTFSMRTCKKVGVKQLSEGSEDSGPISSTLHDNQNAELEFCNFYAVILQKLHQKYQTDYEHICKALCSIRTYREPDKPTRLPCYENHDSRLAYVFSFGIIHSMLMYDRFRDMMKTKPTMLKKIFSMNELKICLVGGGPGFEAAAICKFLRKAIMIFKPDTSSRLLIRVTILDSCTEWEAVAECLFTALQNELQPLIEVDFRFVPADLTEELSPAVIHEIESSYIVLMFKFVNEVFDKCGPSTVEKMLKGIVDVMSFESYLFFLDNAGGGNFKIFQRRINNIPSTARFYGPKLHHCQELKEDTLETFYFFVQDIFQTLKCTCKTTVSCSVWLKINVAEQDDNSLLIPENFKEKKIEKKNCNEKSGVEQDIHCSIHKSTDVKKMKNCKDKVIVEQNTSSAIIEAASSKDNQKRMKACKEKVGVEQDKIPLVMKNKLSKNYSNKAKNVPQVKRLC